MKKFKTEFKIDAIRIPLFYIFGAVWYADDMDFKLVIFDLDGTLLDTFQDLQNAVNDALSACGYPTRTYAEVRGFVGDGVHNLILRAVPRGTDAAAAEKVFRVFIESYGRRKSETTKPYCGVTSMLKYLKAHGVSIAVFSNKIDAAVKQLVAELLPEIDYAQGETDAVPRKPDPSGVEEIRARFGVSAAETLFVGDSEIDFYTSKNAGVSFVGVLWGARNAEEMAACGIKCAVSSVTEFIDILSHWEAKKCK